MRYKITGAHAHTGEDVTIEVEADDEAAAAKAAKAQGVLTVSAELVTPPAPPGGDAALPYAAARPTAPLPVRTLNGLTRAVRVMREPESSQLVLTIPCPVCATAMQKRKRLEANREAEVAGILLILLGVASLPLIYGFCFGPILMVIGAWMVGGTKRPYWVCARCGHHTAIFRE